MAKGFLRGANNDLVIVDGKFAVGDDDNQNMIGIAFIEPGHLKSAPLIGAGFKRLPNARIDIIRRAINNLKFQLNADKFKGVVVDYNNGNMTLDGYR